MYSGIIFYELPGTWHNSLGTYPDKIRRQTVAILNSFLITTSQPIPVLKLTGININSLVSD